MRNVLDFGAIPDGFTDSSDAFEKALANGDSIYVPRGKYRISRTLHLQNQNLFGDSMFSTSIEMTSSERSAVVIAMGGRAVLADIRIGFAPGILEQNEKQGERVGILTGCRGKMLHFGSTVRNVHISEIGTALYSEAENESESFSVTYDTLEISDFTYRGVDFIAKNRTGNVYRNLYIHSKYEVDTLFSLDTEESEADISQLNVEHTRCLYGIRLVGVRALAASTIHIEGLIWKNSAIYIENSSGGIEAVTVYYCAIETPRLSMIQIGDGVYDIKKEWAWAFPDTLSYLRIGTLHTKGLNDPNKSLYGRACLGLTEKQAEGFCFFERKPDAKGSYEIYVDNYVWYTFQKDHEVYESMPSRGDVLIVRRKK